MTRTFGTSEHVDVPGGRRLHLMSRGSGTTAVVLESGLGMSRNSWGCVVPLLADDARCVVYDRAGLGRSDVDPEPRTLDRLADDLVRVVDHVGADRVVLAGHSWGGPVVRVAAARLGSDRVAGVVVVDQADEHCALYFEPSSVRRFTGSIRWVPRMSRLGLYRLLGSRPGRVQPADVVAAHRSEDFGAAGAAGMVAEMEVFLDELAMLRDDPPVLGTIPPTVVSGTRVVRADKKARAAIVAAHRVTASAPNATLVEARRSAHLVMFDEPDVVADAVRALL